MAAKSGDTCTACKRGVLGVVSSQCRGDCQVRYLRCPRCGMTDKSVVPASEIRRRCFTR